MKRVLSLILSLIMAFSIVTGMDISVFAAGEYENHAKYLAELTFNGDYIHYDYLEKFQYDMKAASEYMVDATAGTKVEKAFETWDGICTIAQPSGLVEDLTLQEQYEAMIYTIVLETLASEGYVDFTYENALSNSIDFINLLSETTNGAQLYDKKNLTADDKLILKNCANKLTSASSSGWGALAEYTSIVGEIGDIVDSIIEISVSTAEIIDRTSALLQLTENLNYVVAYLERVKNAAPNYIMRAAVQEVIENVAGSAEEVVADAVLDWTFSLGVVANKYAVDFLYGELCLACPILAGVVIGLNAGIAVSDLLFARSQEVEQYAHMKKFTELMTASRTALRYAENSCAVNITYETAAEWVFGVDFVHNVYISNQNCAVDYYKTVSTGGWVQKVKCLFDSSIYESYENYKNTVEKYNEYYTLTLDAFHNFWVYDFSEDYSETYDKYTDIRDGNYEFVETSVTEVNFVKPKYELGMNQCAMIPAIAYPASTATLCYSSSDTSVITVSSNGSITPVGEGTAKIIATANNGVQGFCEITVYPYNVSVNDTGYTIDRYLGIATEVTIPSEINDVYITKIGAAFSGITSITQVIIPDSVTGIGDNAFRDCGDSLTSITIPDSVTSIGGGAFYNCNNLTSLYITDITAWCSIDFVNVYSTPFGGYTNNLNLLYLNGEKVTDLVVPNGVTKISDYAFFDFSSLTSITIPDSVTSIGSSAFSYCDSLTSIVIGNGVTNIGSYAFNECTSVTSVTIGDSVTSIGRSAFNYCKSLTSINIPDSVTSIGACAFYGCTNLASVTIGDSLTSIGDSAFSYCDSLTSIIIPDSVTFLGKALFAYCDSLKNIVLPNGAASLPSLYNTNFASSTGFFEGCSSLTSITIPDSVTSIGGDAFRDCSSLASVTIPDSVTSIGNNAFRDCTNLTSVYITDIAVWCCIDFGNIYTNPLIWAGNLYLNGELVTDLVVPYGVSNISGCAFYGCTSLTSITIPDSVTSIGYYAFSDCTNLTNVTIGDGVTNIGPAAFFYCKSLTSVTIPDSVTSIGSQAFEDCSSLTSVTIPDSVTSIGSSVFEDCSSLASVTIPDSVTSIGSSAFSNCTSLTSITIPDSVTSIGSSAFSGCISLTSISIPDSVTQIGNYAFNCCNELDYVFYTGSESEWNNITKGSYNQPLNDAIIHYNLTNHSYGDLLTIEPTCEEAGKKYYKCSECGYIDIFEILPAIGHVYSNEWTVEVEPTCAEEGSRSKTCSTCGYILTETISALDHSYSNEWTIDKAATCIEDGSKSHHCTVCGDKTDVTIIGATGHNFIDDVCQFCGSISKLNYEVYDNYVVITGYNGLKTDVVIPDTISGLPVTVIDEKAFYNCTDLTSIIIPDSVTSIGNYAFCSCTNLTSIIIPDGVTVINDYTFSNCTKLSSISIPNTVTNIGVGAFWSCIKLTSITIPDSVISISRNAFQNCNSLTEVYYWGVLSDWKNIDIDVSGNEYLINSTISHRCVNNNCSYSDEWTIDVQPTCTKEGSKSHHCTICGYKKDITEISALGHDYSDEWTIDNPATCIEDGRKSHHCSRCDKKTDVTVIMAITNHSWDDGFCPICEVSLWDYEVYDDYVVVTGYNGYKTDVVVPGAIAGLPVTEIDDFAFAENSVLKSITIGKKVTKIGEGAFYFCPNLVAVNISDSVASIYNNAFCFCDSLVSINVDVNNGNFSSVDGVLFDKNKEVLLQYPIGKKESTYKIPDGVKSIGAFSFYFCNNLNSVLIPETVINIGFVSFVGCEKLVSVAIPNSVNNIEEMAFAECTNLSSVTIPDSVTSIGEDAFYNIPGKIYCIKDSEAHEHAVAYNIDYELVSVLGTSNTHINYDDFIICTYVENCSNITDILEISSTANVVTTASHKQNIKLMGTGSIISVYEGDTFIGDFTLIVNGDTNGDSICDALDCFEVERASNGNGNLAGAYAMAADSNSDEVVDITDYQAIVNKALAS